MINLVLDSLQIIPPPLQPQCTIHVEDDVKRRLRDVGLLEGLDVRAVFVRFELAEGAAREREVGSDGVVPLGGVAAWEVGDAEAEDYTFWVGGRGRRGGRWGCFHAASEVWGVLSFGFARWNI